MHPCLALTLATLLLLPAHAAALPHPSTACDASSSVAETVAALDAYDRALLLSSTFPRLDPDPAPAPAYAGTPASSETVFARDVAPDDSPILRAWSADYRRRAHRRLTEPAPGSPGDLDYAAPDPAPRDAVTADPAPGSDAERREAADAGGGPDDGEASNAG